jgi:hypothetical protein
MANFAHTREENATHLTRCSNACTRAGTAALFAATVAFALAPFLSDSQKRLDIIDYRDLRDQLSATIEFLTLDHCLLIWAEAHKVSLYLTTLDQIAAIDCKRVGTTLGQQLQREVEAQDKAKSIKSPAFQQAPSHLEDSEAVSDEVTGAFLRVLKAHDRFRGNDFIARHSLAWETRLALRLKERNWLPNKNETNVYGLHTRYMPPMPVSENDLRKYLTVGAAVDVANFRKPDLADEKNLLTEHSLTLPQVSIPLPPEIAASLVQTLLLILLWYFYLFQKEALSVAGSSFPGTATLFSVLQRTKIAQWSFYILCTLPVLASLRLVSSFQPTSKIPWVINLPLLVLTFLVAVLVAREFGKASRQNG